MAIFTYHTIINRAIWCELEKIVNVSGSELKRIVNVLR